MLILTRKLNESFLMEVPGEGEPVEIKVVELAGGQVRLGISAPKECKIWRKELFQTVQQNRQAATVVSVSNLRSLVVGIQEESTP